MCSKLEGAQKLVLNSLIELAHIPGGDVEDFRIASHVRIPVENVRDWLETLHDQEMVERWTRSGGISAQITARGRLALNVDAPVFVPRHARETTLESSAERYPATTLSHFAA